MIDSETLPLFGDEPAPEPPPVGRWLRHDQWTWDDWHRLWRNPPKPRTEPEA